MCITNLNLKGINIYDYKSKEFVYYDEKEEQRVEPEEAYREEKQEEVYLKPSTDKQVSFLEEEETWLLGSVQGILKSVSPVKKKRRKLTHSKPPSRAQVVQEVASNLDLNSELSLLLNNYQHSGEVAYPQLAQQAVVAPPSLSASLALVKLGQRDIASVVNKQGRGTVVRLDQGLRVTSFKKDRLEDVHLSVCLLVGDLVLDMDAVSVDMCVLYWLLRLDPQEEGPREKVYAKSFEKVSLALVLEPTKDVERLFEVVGLLEAYSGSEVLVEAMYRVVSGL